MSPSPYVLCDTMEILSETFLNNIINKGGISGGKCYCPMLYIQNKTVYDRAKHVSPLNLNVIIH
jgi:hypothetical protein